MFSSHFVRRSSYDSEVLLSSFSSEVRVDGKTRTRMAHVCQQFIERSYSRTVLSVPEDGVCSARNRHPDRPDDGPDLIKQEKRHSSLRADFTICAVTDSAVRVP